MNFHRPSAEIFVPDGEPPADALARTTHLCVAAHQDDIEVMAFHGIVSCFGRGDGRFAGVTVTDGAGSPRDGLYAGLSDAEMTELRRREQKKAALVGEFAAHVFLDFPSSLTRDPAEEAVIEDLAAVLDAARPRVLYAHNPADRHETHVAVALRTIAAARRLPPEARPSQAYGCEVWGDLDWLEDSEKVVLDVSGRESLASALLGIFDSQVAGGSDTTWPRSAAAGPTPRTAPRTTSIAPTRSPTRWTSRRSSATTRSIPASTSWRGSSASAATSSAGSGG